MNDQDQRDWLAMCVKAAHENNPEKLREMMGDIVVVMEMEMERITAGRESLGATHHGIAEARGGPLG